MTIDLAEIAAPEHTAVVSQELRDAVVGPDAGLSALAVTTTSDPIAAWT